MSDDHTSARGESSPDEKYDVGADEAHFADPEPPTGTSGGGTIHRAKPRRSKAPVIVGFGAAALMAGAVFYSFSRGDDASPSRMVKVPQNINTTPAGEQLARSDAYRQSLEATNLQGSQQAALTTDQSFIATPDEPKRPVDPPKPPIPVVEPKLPGANDRKVEVREKIVYRDRPVSNIASQIPQQPQADWAGIDALSKLMQAQANGLSSSWSVGKSKNTVVIKQELYADPKDHRTGVPVRVQGSTGIVSSQDDLPRGMKGEVRDRRDRLASRNPNVSPVETIPQDASYQADLDTSLPYLSVAPADNEPRLQVSTGQRYGAGGAAFSGDYYATAGSITYAVIVNGADTDTPGPVVAKIMRGPLKGARLIGSFKENDETTAMVVQFDRVVLQDGTNLDAKAYAIDALKGTLAVKSEYDARLLQRYAPRLAGAFLGGIGRTLSQTEQTIVPLGLTGAGIARPKPKFEEGLYAGAGEVGDQLAKEIEDMGPDGPIVRLNAGKLIGVLFTENVQRF